MPALAPDALARELERGARGGVYFLHGEEEYLKEETVAAIVAAHIDPGTRDFNLDQLRGSEVDAGTLASAVRTPPMMADWRVVVVREAQALAGSPRLRSAVESVLDRPLPGLVLVLVAQIPGGSNARFYHRLKTAARSVEFAALSAEDVPGWLMARAEAAGMVLDPDAATALAAAVGPSLNVLVSELAKLTEYVGERRRISREDVEVAVGAVPRQDRWEWIDLVGGGRFGEARRTLPILLGAGESGVRLITGLGTHLLRIGLALAGGARALEAELPPRQRWLSRRIVPQARHWTAGRLNAALRDLLRADRLLKSASLDDRQVMEEWLLRLEARAARRATP